MAEDCALGIGEELRRHIEYGDTIVTHLTIYFVLEKCGYFKILFSDYGAVS